jgi:hypothetical protein
MFAVERGYDAKAQVMGMEMEGIDHCRAVSNNGAILSGP